MNKYLLLFLFFVIPSYSVIAQNKDISKDSVNTSGGILNKKITFYAPEGKLEDILNKLSKEQDIKLSFSHERVNGVYIKAHNFNSESLASILNSILKNTDLGYEAVGSVVVIVKKDETELNTIKTVKNSPSGTNEKKIKSHFNKIKTNSFFPETRNFFIEASFGIVGFMPKINEADTEGWEETLNFKYKTPVTSYREITIGYKYKSILMNIGFGHHNFEISGSGNYLKEKGKSGKEPEIRNVSIIQNYSIINLPIEVMVIRRKNNFFGGIGSSIEFNFIKATSNQYSSLQEYYEKDMEAGMFFQKTKRISTSSSLFLKGGVFLAKNFSVNGTISYNHTFSSISQNSLYSIQPRSINSQLGLMFFIK